MLLGMAATAAGQSPPHRRMLERTITPERLAQVLDYGTDWVSYPSYYDRKGWAALVAPEMAEAIIAAGEKALDYQWKPDLATDYLEYKRSGRILTGRNNHMALQALTLAELVEGEGRFMDAIINGTWFLCETSWLHSAHAYYQKDQSGLPDRDEPTLELVVADIGAQMAWTHYFFAEEFDKVSLLIDKRVRQEVKNRIIDPYFARDDYWWMGLTDDRKVNNWNPWINYNVLQAVMLMENDPQRRAQAVWKLIRSVDRFIDGYQADGACDEGPTYWGHAGANFFKCLDLFSRITGGEVDIFGEELIGNIGRYIYRAHIADSYFVNFADAAAIGTIKPGVVYQYGKRIGDPVMMGFASDYARRHDWGSKVPGGYLATVLDDMCISDEVMKEPGSEPLIGHYWFDGTQVCVARDREGSKKGFFFAAKGGHNNESHNHNDVGSCLLYYNGLPVLMDVGVGTYVRQTFSSERYTIWTMQSGYHNLPTVNGMDQHNGVQFAARDAKFTEKGNKFRFTVDIAGAYPETAGVRTWTRGYELDRGRSFTITDRWQLESVKDSTVLNFMTVCEVEPRERSLLLRGEGFTLSMEYDPKNVRPEVETITLTDRSLLRSWPNGKIYRIRFRVLSGKTSGSNTIRIVPAT